MVGEKRGTLSTTEHTCLFGETIDSGDYTNLRPGPVDEEASTGIPDGERLTVTPGFLVKGQKKNVRDPSNPLQEVTEVQKEYFESLMRTLSTGILSRFFSTFYNTISVNPSNNHIRSLVATDDSYNIISTNRNGSDSSCKPRERKIMDNLPWPFNRVSRRQVSINEKNTEYESYLLDVSSEEFRKRAERFKQEGKESLNKDIDEIISTIFGPESVHKEALMATRYRDAVDSVFDEFTVDSERFRHTFPALPSGAREYVLRRILQEDASGPHDTWLEDNYSYEIHEAAHYVMRETYVNTYSHLLVNGELEWDSCKQAYMTLTPNDVEGILKKRGPSDEIFAKEGMESVLRTFQMRGDNAKDVARFFHVGKVIEPLENRVVEGSEIARLFPVLASGFALRKKKEYLDESMEQCLESEDGSPPSLYCVVDDTDRGYVYARKIAIQGVDDEGIKDITYPVERYSDGLNEVGGLGNFGLTSCMESKLERPESLVRGVEDRYPDTISIVNQLLAYHMLQPPEEAEQFKGYLRENFQHNQAYILYSAIQENLSGVITHR